MRDINKFIKPKRTRAYPKGQILLYAGDEVHDVYHIKSGFVKLYMILESGEQRTNLILQKGDTFPLFVSSGEKYELINFYETMGDCELDIYDKAEVDHMLENSTDATFLREYLGYMSIKNKDTMEIMSALKMKTSLEKLAYVLIFLAKNLGTKKDEEWYEIKGLHFTHQELAEVAGLTRETVTSRINSLRRSKALKDKKDSFMINVEILGGISSDD